MTDEQYRLEWISRYTSRCSTPPPRFGTPEWRALPDGDAKVAAICIGAEAQHRADELADLAVEHYRFIAKRAEDGEFQSRGAGHRHEWGSTSFRAHPVNRRGDAA